MDAAAIAANANANAVPEHVAISWLAVTTLFMTGIFLGHRALCRPSITPDEATNLLRAAQKSITVTRYHPTTVLQAPTRTITTTTTSYFPWSRTAELGPKLQQLIDSLPWDIIDRLLISYIVFVVVYLAVRFWLRLRGRNPVRRLAAATSSRMERIRKRPELLGTWSVTTDDILNLPY